MVRQAILTNGPKSQGTKVGLGSISVGKKTIHRPALFLSEIYQVTSRNLRNMFTILNIPKSITRRRDLKVRCALATLAQSRNRPKISSKLALQLEYHPARISILFRVHEVLIGCGYFNAFRGLPSQNIFYQMTLTDQYADHFNLVTVASNAHFQ